MTASISFRKATVDDISEVERVDATDVYMSRAAVKGRNRLMGKIMGGDVFLALVGSEVVGYARYDILWPESVPLLAWLWVAPSHRKSGIACELRNFSFRALATEGFTAILRSACTHRPEMITKLELECGAPAGRLRFEDGAEEVFFWHQLRMDAVPAR